MQHMATEFPIPCLYYIICGHDQIVPSNYSNHKKVIHSSQFSEHVERITLLL